MSSKWSRHLPDVASSNNSQQTFFNFKYICILQWPSAINNQFYVSLGCLVFQKILLSKTIYLTDIYKMLHCKNWSNIKYLIWSLREMSTKLELNNAVLCVFHLSIKTQHLGHFTLNNVTKIAAYPSKSNR